MNENNQTNTPKQSRYIQMVLNFLMVSVLLTCFALIVGYSIQIVYPTWGLLWFPILTFVITLLTLLVRYAQHVSPQLNQDQMIFVILEIVLLILIARLVSLLSMASMGWTAVWQEVLSWQHDFLQNFFNLDMLFRSFALLLIWLLTWLFSVPLNKLEEDEVLMEQEKMGYTFTDRYDARRNLIALIFNIGFLMIVLMVVWRSNLLDFLADPKPTGFFVTILLIYFFTAFIFLALNQYAIMKARWYFSNIQVTPDLSKRWLFYSLVFIFFVMIVIAFLPTGFSLNIPTTATWLVEAVIFVLLTLFSILLAPFIMIMNLVARLFNREPIDEPLEQIAPEAPPMLQQTPGASPWWDLVRSIVFWLVFLAVIIITISFYIRNRPNLKFLLRELKLIHWINDFWKWIIEGFKQARKATTETFQKGLDRIQSFLKNQQEKLPEWSDLIKRMPPRQAIILVYIGWIRWNRRHGLVRARSQTPQEYAQTYYQRFPDDEIVVDSVKALTEVFIQARYSRQSLLKEQAHEAQRLSNLLKKIYPIQQDQVESHL